MWMFVFYLLSGLISLLPVILKRGIKILPKNKEWKIVILGFFLIQLLFFLLETKRCRVK